MKLARIAVLLLLPLALASCQQRERGQLTPDEERRLDTAEAMLDEPPPGRSSED